MPDHTPSFDLVDVPRRQALLDPLERAGGLWDATLSADQDPNACTFDPRPTLSSVFRHSGWRADRQRVYDALHATGQSPWRCLEFASCGDRIRVFRSLDDPDAFKLGGSYCKDRFCIPCANDRAARIRANLLELMPAVRIRMLTLTLRANQAALQVRLDQLFASFSRLCKTVYWKRRVSGGVAFLEVKWNAQLQNWHAHLHILCEGRWLDQRIISNAWREITEGSYVVDIKLAHSRDGVARYAAKYASKPIDPSFVRDPPRLREAIVALKGRRLVHAFGAWRRFKLTQPPEPTAWVEVGTLDEWVQRIASGDPDADCIHAAIRCPGLDAAIRAAINRNVALEPEPPPQSRQFRLRFEQSFCIPW